MLTVRLLVIAVLVLLSAHLGAAEVHVTVYRDTDASSSTDFFQEVGDEDTVLAGVAVTAFVGGAEPAVVTTDDAGVAAFPGAAAGAQLFRVDAPEGARATSRNHAAHLFEVLEAGGPLDYVALGDSSPVEGSATGQRYPERLGAMLQPHFPAGVTVHNLAEGGSTTSMWLPGSPYMLLKEDAIAAADLITMTIGGNDLVDAISLGDINAALAQVDETFANIANIATIYAKLRELNPDADIVFTIYPNYIKADFWQAELGAETVAVVRNIIESIITQMRRDLSANPGMLLGDVHGSLKDADMNLVMADKLHVNDTGHQVYADVVFGALGGVIVPAEGDVAKLFGWADWPDVVVPVPDEAASDADIANADIAGDDAAQGADANDPAGGGDGGSGCAVGGPGATSSPLLVLALALVLPAIRRPRRAHGGVR
jgi:lysophospholipase L1-like esterase